METLLHLTLYLHTLLFLSYLWGMETTPQATFQIRHQAHVLILPMRNGNMLLTPSFSSPLESSYPTYEEWKLFISFSIFTVPRVLILPMRNGNWRSKRIIQLFKRVLILPMRNGNIKIYSIVSVFKFWFLSYLWGMETKERKRKKRKMKKRSYPTYEEWKLDKTLNTQFSI